MTTTGPAGQGGSSGSTHLDGIADELREMWRTRPGRLPREGKIAGVAAGIAQRYDVDPLLVRVAFVVSALFGGAGLWLYIAGWLLLDVPAEQRTGRARRRAEGHDARAGHRPGHIIGAVIVAVIALSVLPLGNGRGGAGLIGAVLLLGALYLLHRRRPQPPGAPYPDHPAAPHVQEPPVGEADEPFGTATPPSWDPLGMAPFAWDLPDPPPPPPEPAAPRSRVTVVTLGVALIAVAAATAAAIGGVAWLTPGRVGAVGLAVIGVGLLVGALRRTGHGLLVVAAPLAAFVVLASVAHSLDLDSDVGERTYRPVTVAELQDEYSTGAGELHLDLTGLTLTESREVTVNTTVGRVEVTVPRGMAVDARCDSTIGSTDCPPASPPGPAPRLTIDAHSTLGEVVVTRE